MSLTLEQREILLSVQKMVAAVMVTLSEMKESLSKPCFRSAKSSTDSVKVATSLEIIDAHQQMDDSSVEEQISIDLGPPLSVIDSRNFATNAIPKLKEIELAKPYAEVNFSVFRPYATLGLTEGAALLKGNQDYKASEYLHFTAIVAVNLHGWPPPATLFCNKLYLSVQNMICVISLFIKEFTIMKHGGIYVWRYLVCSGNYSVDLLGNSVEIMSFVHVVVKWSTVMFVADLRGNSISLWYTATIHIFFHDSSVVVSTCGKIVLKTRAQSNIAQKVEDHHGKYKSKCMSPLQHRNTSHCDASLIYVCAESLLETTLADFILICTLAKSSLVYETLQSSKSSSGSALTFSSGYIMLGAGIHCQK